MTSLTPYASSSVSYDPFFNEDGDFPYFPPADGGLAEQVSNLIEAFPSESDFSTERKRPAEQISVTPAPTDRDISAKMIPHLFATYLAFGSYLPEERPLCIPQSTWEELRRSKESGLLMRVVSLNPFKFLVRLDLDIIYFILATQGYQRMLFFEPSDKWEKKWLEWWGKAKVLTPVTTQKITDPDTLVPYVYRTITPPLKLIGHPSYIGALSSNKIEHTYHLIERILKRMLSEDSKINLIRAGSCMRKLTVLCTYSAALTNAVRDVFPTTNSEN
jgi:hypothetical protein